MNRIYCKVWNRALGQWVVASELARGDSAGVTGAHRRTLPHRHALVIALLAVGMTADAQANTVVGNSSFASSDGVICSAIGTPAPNAAAAWTCQVPNGSSGYAIISGIDATATGAPNLAGLASALGPNAVLIGTTTTQASADSAVAIGPGAQATADSATALGDRAHAAGVGAVALGFNARAEDEYSVAIGAGAIALGPSSYALGNNAVARDFDVAIGAAALIGSTSSARTTAIGYQAGANAPNAVESSFIGFAAGAQSDGTSNSYVGSRAGFMATGDLNVANGTFALAGASGDHNIAQGNGAGALVTGDDNVAIGRQAGTLTTFAADGTPLVHAPASFSETISIGRQAGGLADRAIAIAIGTQASATGEGSIALGPAASTGMTAVESVAIGSGSTATGALSLAAGSGATASADTSVAIGRSATTEGRFSVALGSNAAALDQHSIALGSARSEGQYSIAAGIGATARGSDTLALGTNTSTGGFNAIAIGTGAQAEIDDAVALGSNAIADTAAGVAGYDPRTGLASTDATSSWTSTLAAVSVGSAGNTRQITHVAAGTRATDAVNVAQLQAAQTRYYSVNDTGAVRAPGVGDNSDNLGATGIEALAVGRNARAAGDGAVAVGNSRALGQNSTAIGWRAFVSAATENSVAIGNLVSIEDAGNDNVLVGSNLELEGAGEANVVIGSDLQEGGLTGSRNVLLGQGLTASGDDNVVLGTGASVTDSSNQVAIGAGAQATATGVDANVALGAGSSANGSTLATAAYNPGTATLAGVMPVGEVSVGSAGNERRITNVAAGAADTDAVNVSQLKAVQASAAAAETHYYSVNDNGVIGPNYNNDGATGTGALAAGIAARAEGQADTALGFDSHASGSNSIAIGTSSRASQAHATALGYSANAGGPSAVAIGFVAQAAGAGNIAIGHGAATTAATATAMGTFASATQDNALALGTGASATGESALSIGTNARAVNMDDIAIGRDSVASGADSIAISGRATGQSSVAIAGAAEGSSAMALGGRAVGDVSLAILDGQALGQNSIAIGVEVVARGDRSTVLGWVSEANGDQSVAIGAEAIAEGVSSIAFGNGAQANGVQAISIGTGNVVNGDRSGAIGDPSIIDADDSYSIGNNNTLGAAANNSFVLGNNVDINVDNATALGNGTSVTQAGGVALGSGSVASTAAGMAGYDPRTGLPSTDTSATWVSTLAAVSVGSAGNTRQITHVAAGTEDTDAVNVAQLRVAQDEATTHYFSVNSIDTGAGSNYDNDGATGANAIAIGNGAFAPGVRDTVMGYRAGAGSTPGGSNTFIGDLAGNDNSGSENVALGTQSGGAVSGYHNTAIGTAAGTNTSGNFNVAIGSFSGAGFNNPAGGTVSNTVSIGTYAAGMAEDSVALGAYSIADRAAGMAGYDPATGAASTSTDMTWVGALGAVSVGSSDGTRQIINVAAGTEDTDAVNVAQLRAVSTTAGAGWNATDAAGNTANIGPGGTVTFESGNGNIAVSQTGVDDDGVVDITLSNDLDLTAAGSVTTGDTLVNNAGVAVGTNVALGSGGLTVIGGTTTTVVNGDGLTSGLVALSGVSNDITGLSNTTLTDPTFATAGRAATEEQLQLVEQSANAGWNATDAAGNTANIGPGGTVTFEGDANIAVSQTGVDDDGVVAITLNRDLDVDSVTAGDTLLDTDGLTITGGPSVTIAGINAGGTVITNVAAGVAPTDAVNVSQLTTVETAANAGWNATDAAGNTANIGPDGTVTFESGNANIAVSQTGADDDGVVDITLSNNLDLTAAGSVTTGDTLVNNAGVTVGTNVALGSGGLTVIGGTTTTIVSGTGVSSGNVVLSGVSNDITGLSNRTLIDPTFATAGRAATEEQLRLVRNEITSGFTPPTRYYGVNSLGGGNQLGEGATGEDAMALGKDAESEGQEAVAMGRGARATEDDSMALGTGSQALSLNALAIGAGAVASHENSIALGAGSATTVGARTGYQGAYVGSSSSTGEMNIGGRQLTGVAAGSAATDAVNISQLQGGVTQAITEANNYTDARIATIEGDLVDIRGDITDIQGDIVRIEGDITNLDTRVGDVEGDVANLTTTVNQFDNRVTNLERGGSGPFQVTQGETYVAPAPTGANASAGGNGAVASGDNSTAIGQGAVASHDNSVALGRGSATTVGAQRDYNAAYVGTSTSTGEVNIGGRTISGVAPGIAGTDAVNVNQLNAGVDYAINQANAYTDNRFNQFEGDMWNLERGYRGGTASAMAMAGLPQAYLPGKSMLSVAFGGYRGEYGMAFGLSTISDNGRWVYKAQATGNTTRDWGFSVGAGLQW